jgi:hypothetical protein
VFQEEHRPSAELGSRRHPYSGAAYFTRPFRRSVMQGQAVYAYRPPADLYLGDVESGPWDKLPIEAGGLRCPDGTRVPVPPSLHEEATTLVREHAGRLLSRYRLSEPGDVQGDWARYASPHGGPPVFAYGDYNDDGMSDLAFLLPLRRPRRLGRGFGVFCLLSQDRGAYRLETVVEDTDGLLSAHGLAVARPGRRSTFCGLPGSPGPECAGQPREVVLQTDAIHVYAFESGADLFAWDAASARFRRVRIAD